MIRGGHGVRDGADEAGGVAEGKPDVLVRFGVAAVLFLLHAFDGFFGLHGVAEDLHEAEDAAGRLSALGEGGSGPGIGGAAEADEEVASGDCAEVGGVGAVGMEVGAFAEKEGSQVLPISAKTEQEIAELPEEDKAMFLEELGLEESGLDRLIKCSYALLGLISFLTGGTDECRAWTIKKGTRAPQAAGKIHSDFERGFIRAEVVSFDVLKELGTMAAVREKGLLRSEGKEYVMQDGDIVVFRFNV